MNNFLLLAHNLFSDKEKVNLHVFGFNVHHWVVSKKHFRLIITKYLRDFGRNEKFLENSLDPKQVCSGMC